MNEGFCNERKQPSLHPTARGTVVVYHGLLGDVPWLRRAEGVRGVVGRGKAGKRPCAVSKVQGPSFNVFCETQTVV